MTKKEVQKSPIISREEVPKRKVLICKESICKSEKAEIVKLRHPQHGNEAIYLIGDGGQTIQEIIKLDDKRSLFINNSISSNGNFYISTPIDPLFIILPYFEKEKRCCPLDQLVYDEEFPSIELLLKSSGIKFIQQIADKRGDETLNTYIYNEEKTLKWLSKKVDRIVSALKGQGYQVCSNITSSANFVKSENGEDEESYIRYAFGMLSDYLSESLSGKLAKFLKLPDVSQVKNLNKRKDEPESELGPRKKQKLDENEKPATVAIKPEKKVKVGKKVQELANAAKGTKSISSFFKK
ncbi:ribonuclease H2 subunit B [Cimex lectularius]|uniref:Ribonuclease H2 subunit B n=1 Tax=Cimex lectularius TaxID=79782 RepID=A0A8I6R710_CIMLE|nr:ribonuclease H2 subunit B [Cimex lectularius]